MESDDLQEISERDQLWASLRGIQSEILKMAAGELDGSDRQQELTVLLARIVCAELDFRARLTGEE